MNTDLIKNCTGFAWHSYILVIMPFYDLESGLSPNCCLCKGNNWILYANIKQQSHKKHTQFYIKNWTYGCTNIHKERKYVLWYLWILYLKWQEQINRDYNWTKQ